MEEATRRQPTLSEGQHRLVHIDGITVRQRDRLLLEDTSWTIRIGENWAVIGPNGAGKSSLVKALCGEAAVVAGRVHRPDTVAYVSFEQHQQLLSREAELDHSRHFAGDLWQQTLVGDLVAAEMAASRADRHTLMALLAIYPLLERGVRHLSTGEMRRLVIFRALLRSPRLLVLDEPFDGLDRTTRSHLAASLEKMMVAGMTLVVVTHRTDELPKGITHVLCVRDGRVTGRGSREKMLVPPVLESLYASLPQPRQLAPAKTLSRPPRGERSPCPVLLEMKAVSVRYGEKAVLRGLDWRVRQGENWAVLGPNGAGKTTLLHLITGDNLQGYANRIHLFGRRKGSGESRWEIRRRMGMVSPELHLRYHRPVSVRDVVRSGFFDSIGLYRHCSAAQSATADQWLAVLGLAHLAHRKLDRLSTGERRLVLIARAMVTSPELLVLDEPCQGLDPGYRHQVLAMLQLLCRDAGTSLLYVTHHADEIPPCITHILEMWPPGSGKEPSYRVVRRGEVT
jgi:molybdate transport system ATP-binding protein